MMCSVPRLPSLLAAALCAALLAACSEARLLVHTAKQLSPHDDATTGGVYKVGTPYQVAGVWYYPKVDYDYTETGIASWYGPGFHGKRTANGETFDENLATAAHRTLPLPSVVRVTNLENGRSIRVRVNDRGPFAHSRIIDMSRYGAQLLGFHRQGTAKVRVEVLAEESRQAAAFMGAGDTQLARAGEAEPGPAVKPAPRGAVTRVPISGEPAPAPEPAPVAKASAPAPEPVLGADPELVQVPVEKTNMYIQAGAFADYDNANRLRARLAPLGTAQVSQIQLGDQAFFRVRIGPLPDLSSADAMLERVIGAGHTDARLIVDR